MDDWEGWPVLPEGIEGVIFRRMPADWTPPPQDCFVCGEPMPEAGKGVCWGVPGRGVAHCDCYEPTDDLA